MLHLLITLLLICYSSCNHTEKVDVNAKMSDGCEMTESATESSDSESSPTHTWSDESGSCDENGNRVYKRKREDEDDDTDKTRIIRQRIERVDEDLVVIFKWHE